MLQGSLTFQATSVPETDAGDQDPENHAENEHKDESSNRVLPCLEEPYFAFLQSFLIAFGDLLQPIVKRCSPGDDLLLDKAVRRRPANSCQRVGNRREYRPII